MMRLIAIALFWPESMTLWFYKVEEPFGCFSNFSPHSIYLDGFDWPTSEHYYQAHKFDGSPFPARMHQIRQAPTPELAAALGRDRTFPIRPDWEAVKWEVMYRAVLCKFQTHGEIRNILLGTGDELIVENSPRDWFWGCGADQTGQNLLGKMLMQIRGELRYCSGPRQEH
jgi:ribA/ribD-fused uncharacterized protein